MLARAGDCLKQELHCANRTRIELESLLSPSCLVHRHGAWRSDVTHISAGQTRHNDVIWSSDAGELQESG